MQLDGGGGVRDDAPACAWLERAELDHPEALQVRAG